MTAGKACARQQASRPRGGVALLALAGPAFAAAPVEIAWQRGLDAAPAKARAEKKPGRTSLSGSLRRAPLPVWLAVGGRRVGVPGPQALS